MYIYIPILRTQSPHWVLSPLAIVNSVALDMSGQLYSFVSLPSLFGGKYPQVGLLSHKAILCLAL